MRSLKIPRIVALLTAVIILTSCTELSIYGPGQQGQGRPNNRPEGEVTVTVVISAGEARILAVNRGVTGMRPLPPGIQRNLARGKPLPPGIARQMVPRSLLADLPVILDHEWRIAGRDLILIALGTLVVMEILEDVFD